MSAIEKDIIRHPYTVSSYKDTGNCLVCEEPYAAVQHRMVPVLRKEDLLIRLQRMVDGRLTDLEASNRNDWVREAMREIWALRRALDRA